MIVGQARDLTARAATAQAKVLLAEVTAAAEKLFNLIDKNGDGHCTRAEIILGLRTHADLQEALRLPGRVVRT